MSSSPYSYSPRGAALAVLECRDPLVLIEGPRGTGKTRPDLELVRLRALQYPGSRHLLCRQSRTSITQSVLVTFEEMVLLPGEKDRDMTRRNRDTYRFANGSEIIIGGLDDAERVKSAEYDTATIIEASEIDRDSLYTLQGCMRWNRMPFTQIIMETNPSTPGHWLNQAAMPCDDAIRLGGPEGIARYHRSPVPEGYFRRFLSRHEDNPSLTKAYLESLAKMPGMIGLRHYRGVWAGGDGLVYQEFARSRNVCQPFTWPNEWPMIVVVDPGYDHPCAILWLGIAPDETIYVVDELYRGGLTVRQHARDIKARNAGRTVVGYYLDPQYGFNHTMHSGSGQTIAEQFYDEGLGFSRWPRTAGHVEAQVDAVRRRLIEEPKPKLKVFATCPHTIAEFETWKYKRSRTGERVAGDDQYVDADNHALDALRGGVAAVDQWGVGGVKDTERAPWESVPPGGRQLSFLGR